MHICFKIIKFLLHSTLLNVNVKLYLYCTAQTECILLAVQQILCYTLEEEYGLRVFEYGVQCLQNRK
jgi:hypothetical protein